LKKETNKTKFNNSTSRSSILRIAEFKESNNLVMCWGIALLAHLLAFGGFYHLGYSDKTKEKFSIKMKVLEKQKPKILEKVKKEFIKKKEKKKIVDIRDFKLKPKKNEIKPTKVKKDDNQIKESKPKTKQVQPPEPVFGLDKASVKKGQGGSFNVRVGNTVMKEMELEFTDPSKLTPYYPVQLYTITKLPELVKVVKPKYTKKARDEGIEGVIILEVDIDEDGDVRYAKVIKKLGYGLDENAIKAVSQFKYKPAMQGRVGVAVKKKVKIRFILEDY